MARLLGAVRCFALSCVRAETLNQSSCGVGRHLSCISLAQDIGDVLAQSSIRQGMGMACLALMQSDASVSTHSSTEHVAITWMHPA